MPSVSTAQRRAAAIALHNPEALSDKNRGMAAMNISDLMKFASTPEKGLPHHVPKKRPHHGR